MKIRHELTPYFCETYQIDKNKDYPVEWIDPERLLVSERLDLIAKLKYIESRESGQIATFDRECYFKHIEAFSYGTFKEGGSKDKDSIEKFFASFDQLIDAIKLSGFDISKSVIPVGKDNILLDGAHRVAVAIYFDKKVPIIRLPDAKVMYDASYFRKRLLDRQYLDFMMLTYAKLKKNVHLAFVSPAIRPKQQQFQQLQKAINQDGKLIYKEKMRLPMTLEGDFSSITERLTHSETTAQNHTTKYFLLYFFETENEEALERIQSHIREIFRNSPYITQFSTNPKEAVQYLEVLLNADRSAPLRVHNRVTSKTKQAYKWLFYKQRILLLRTLKRSGLFPVFRKIYRRVRKNA